MRLFVEFIFWLFLADVVVVLGVIVMKEECQPYQYLQGIVNCALLCWAAFILWG